MFVVVSQSNLLCFLKDPWSKFATDCILPHSPHNYFFKMSFNGADLQNSLWPPLSLFDVIYLIQLTWQVLMWYKDKSSRLMELKLIILFPCCAYWHMWDSWLSLKKVNAWGIFPAKASSVCLCVCARAGARVTHTHLCVGSYLSWFPSIISPSLHKM